MKISSSLSLIILIFLCSCGNTNEQDDESLSDMLNQEITGDLAYETTAYVEKYWRIVGNAGFDSSIYKIAQQLERNGYILEENAIAEDRLTYHIEKRPLKEPTWEPVNARLKIEGEEELLLNFESNRNMIAINSYSTAEEGLIAEVVHVSDIKTISDLNVKGKIVFAEAHPYYVYKKAVVEGGARGIITYNNPDYLQPEKNTTSIQFRSIPLDQENRSWSIALSYEAKEQLKQRLAEGETKLEVMINTKIYPSEELTVVAEIKGSKFPKERLVFSAHVQEPGANDNATGVGVALEMAATSAKMLKEGKFSPERTLTFLWGDEIVSTRRYVTEDSTRAQDIKWGISLDMVGENTDITGGTFLIEKMPDPSAIWTRGKDEHTEWGAGEVTMEDLKPHYLNDFVINRFLEQGERANWVVKANPFEGGSDHVPFLKANIPGVLFWHFTDQFYHTDNDRLDKVSKSTLKNVGTAALVSAFTLLNANESTVQQMISELETAGIARLQEELAQSKLAIADTSSIASQIEIVTAWENWYTGSIASCVGMAETSSINAAISESQSVIHQLAEKIIEELKSLD
ncbi:MAG: M28 family peptidase [Ekhidna sp.]